MELRALPRPSFLAHDLPNAPQFMCHLLVRGDDVVERVREFSFYTDPCPGETHREITVPHRLQGRENRTQIGRRRFATSVASPITLHGRLRLFTCTLGCYV